MQHRLRLPVMLLLNVQGNTNSALKLSTNNMPNRIPLFMNETFEMLKKLPESTEPPPETLMHVPNRPCLAVLPSGGSETSGLDTEAGVIC